ncbi:MAG: transporter substrate-binding domain-containing protein [Cyanobacteria bacterium J069]
MSNFKSKRDRHFALSRFWKQGLMLAAASLLVMLGNVACSTGSITSQSVAGEATVAQTAPGSEVVPSGGALGATLDQILASGKVRIAVPQDSPPFGAMGTDGQPQGYDVEVAKMVAEALEVEPELVPVTSKNRIPFLQSNKVDMVISSLGATPERAKSIYFSIPYAPFYSGVYSAAGSAIAEYADLAGKTVGVTNGSLEDLELTKRVPAGVEIKRFEDNSTTAAALLAGQVDAIATGNTIANAVMKDNPGKNLGRNFVMRNSPCYIGVRRGDLDLLQWVDVFVANKRLSGDLEALSQEWFNEPLELPTF